MKFTERKTAPFRYDIVGSFLRPEKLKNARADFEEKKISETKLKSVEDECILDLVEKEISAGLKCITDGEFRRSYWHLDFMWGFQGVEHVVMDHGYFFHGEETRADSARISGKIEFINHPFIDHFKFLKEAVSDRASVKLTIPSPSQFYAELIRGENEKHLNAVYPNREELFSDLTKAYHDFIIYLYNQGCRILQLDDCTWGMLCDKSFWEHMTNEEYNIEEIQRLYLKLNNNAIKDLPKDLVVNTHVCRGNYHSTWATSGGYDTVAKNLFGGENVNGYFLEFDDDRSGDFAPLTQVSGDKLVVLGLITSKQPTLEDKASIIARINEASQYVPLDRLALSPQCGFASTEEGNTLSESDQWKKIALVKEIAEEVWG